MGGGYFCEYLYGLLELMVGDEDEGWRGEVGVFVDCKWDGIGGVEGVGGVVGEWMGWGEGECVCVRGFEILDGRNGED